MYTGGGAGSGVSGRTGTRALKSSCCESHATVQEYPSVFRLILRKGSIHHPIFEYEKACKYI